MDSDQQESKVKISKLPEDPSEALELLQKEYGALFGYYYRLYTSVTADFEKMKILLIRARESPRSETISIINGMVEEMDKRLPEMNEWINDTNKAFDISPDKQKFISFDVG